MQLICCILEVTIQTQSQLAVWLSLSAKQLLGGAKASPDYETWFDRFDRRKSVPDDCHSPTYHVDNFEPQSIESTFSEFAEDFCDLSKESKDIME